MRGKSMRIKQNSQYLNFDNSLTPRQSHRGMRSPEFKYWELILVFLIAN